MLPPNAEYSILQAPEVEELQLWFDCNSSLLMSKDKDKFREILRLHKMYLSHLPFWKISFFDDYAVKKNNPLTLSRLTCYNANVEIFLLLLVSDFQRCVLADYI